MQSTAALDRDVSARAEGSGLRMIGKRLDLTFPGALGEGAAPADEGAHYTGSNTQEPQKDLESHLGYSNQK